MRRRKQGRYNSGGGVEDNSRDPEFLAKQFLTDTMGIYVAQGLIVPGREMRYVNGLYRDLAEAQSRDPELLTTTNRRENIILRTGHSVIEQRDETNLPVGITEAAMRYYSGYMYHKPEVGEFGQLVEMSTVVNDEEFHHNYGDGLYYIGGHENLHGLLGAVGKQSEYGESGVFFPSDAALLSIGDRKIDTESHTNYYERMSTVGAAIISSYDKETNQTWFQSAFTSDTDLAYRAVEKITKDGGIVMPKAA